MTKRTWLILAGAWAFDELAAPAMAQVVDLGDGIKRDATAMPRSEPAVGPVNTGHYQTTQPDKQHRQGCSPGGLLARKGAAALGPRI